MERKEIEKILVGCFDALGDSDMLGFGLIQQVHVLSTLEDSEKLPTAEDSSDKKE